MRLALVTTAVLMAAFTFGVPPTATAGDHLACYKVKDTIAKGAFSGVTLTSNDAGPNNTGCTISTGARFCCDPVDKVGVPPQTGGSGPGAPTTRFCCYKVKCAKSTGTTLDFADQFGSRALPVTTPKIVCAPVPTTTTTTLPCAGTCDVCGSCGHGECHKSGGGAGCGAPTMTPVCIDTTTCVTTGCGSDAQCTDPLRPKCVFGGVTGGAGCCAACP